MQQYAYSAFGKIELITDQTGTDVTDAPPVENFYAFTGREYGSESGCYYYRARYYCPEMKRFISEDPIGFAAGDTNTYRYVKNEPITISDPSGRNPLAIAGAIIGAGINVYQAVEAGGNARQVIVSGLVGAVTGAAAGFGGFGLAALAGFANNSTNQIIFTGDVDFGKAAIAGTITGIAGSLGQLTTRALNKIFFPIISESAGFTTGALLGLWADTGISNNEAHACPVPN